MDWRAGGEEEEEERRGGGASVSDKVRDERDAGRKRQRGGTRGKWRCGAVVGAGAAAFPVLSVVRAGGWLCLRPPVHIHSGPAPQLGRGCVRVRALVRRLLRFQSGSASAGSGRGFCLPSVLFRCSPWRWAEQRVTVDFWDLNM